MTCLTIRRGTMDDAARTAELIAAAFAPLQVAEWLVPDPAERVRVLAAQFAILVEDAVNHGEVLLGGYGGAEATGFSAAAVGYRLAGPLPPLDDYDARLAQACGPHRDRFTILDRAFDDHHPDTYPHYYLSYLATLPEQQERGLGTALLDHIRCHADQAQLPAYLVASNERTRDMYERHGFQCLGDPFHLPDGPPMWTMLREPHTVSEVTGTEEAGSGSLNAPPPRAAAEQSGGRQ